MKKPASFLAVGLLLAACSSPPIDGDTQAETSGAVVGSSGGTTELVFLGSAAFLTQCAGRSHTLGCGDPVSSVADTTPYFSAPSSWGRSACRQYYTFELNGRCVEAQRLEVSDRHDFIEGNPGLFDGLGLAHSDGQHCAGSGRASNVRITPGRHCGTAGVTDPMDPDGGAPTGDAGTGTGTGKGGADTDPGKGDGTDTDPGTDKGGDPGKGGDDGDNGGGKGGGDDSGKGGK